jgi:capsular polysaccharide biosynthesis protein
MKTLVIIIAIIIIWIAFFKISLSLIKSKYQAEKLLIEFEKADSQEENLTCCGDEITGEIEDYGICPTCKEHI